MWQLSELVPVLGVTDVSWESTSEMPWSAQPPPIRALQSTHVLSECH